MANGPGAGFPASSYACYAPSSRITALLDCSAHPNPCWTGFRLACPCVLNYTKNVASGPVITPGQRSLHHAKLCCKLLLDLLHVLLVNLNLFARVAQDQPYVPRHRAQAQNFAAAVQRSLGPDPERCVLRFVITHPHRKHRVSNHVMLISLLDLSINRHRELPGQIHNNVSVA